MVKKSSFNKLIENQNIDEIEQHLFFYYLRLKALNYENSKILNDYFKNFNENVDLSDKIVELNILNIKELENHLELLIPVNDRKLNGAFFTPDYIINFIILKLQPKENDSNLDPSCGCGAILIGFIDYYKNKFNKSIREIIAKNIYGSDILDYNIRRTTIILTIYALQFGEILEQGDLNLYCQDSLRAKWDMSFDNIVGNPPYVKFQDLSDENRLYLFNNWQTLTGGAYNLYFAFFELGLKLLKPNGLLGYITPNNYFTSLAGEALRKFFQSELCVTEIIDFSHQKVFDAQTYTAITLLCKNKCEVISYDRIQDNQNPETFLTNIHSSPNHLSDLDSKKWRLLKTDEKHNIGKIETIGIPIGKLFDISAGIATLKDDVFFVDEKKDGKYIKTTSSGVYEIEENVLKPVYKISDFKSQSDIEGNVRKIIFPYKYVNGAAMPIPENEFKLLYPNCYNYLCSARELLLARDKGKNIFEPFYIWGRTQGLKKVGKKIITPTFSYLPRFLILNDEVAFFTNGYGLFFKNPNDFGLFDVKNPIGEIENIDVLQKILNSSIMDYYVKKTSVSIEGGYPCYQKNFIEKFNIPFFNQKEILKLRSLNLPNEINNYLIKKYQLNSF